MESSSTTDDSTGNTDVFRAECGHEARSEETVYLPDVGGVCRDCHTPIALRHWPDVIDTTTVHHHTGESTQYRTWLVGLDEYGRGVYHDERRRRLLVVVPKYHREFRADVTGDERPLRETPPKHSPKDGRIVDSPDNGVLVTYDRIQTESDEFTKRDLCEIVAERASRDDWDALTETVLDRLEYYADQYDTPAYNEDVFPVEEAREVLQAYTDD